MYLSSLKARRQTLQSLNDKSTTSAEAIKARGEILRIEEVLSSCMGMSEVEKEAIYKKQMDAVATLLYVLTLVVTFDSAWEAISTATKWHDKQIKQMFCLFFMAVLSGSNIHIFRTAAGSYARSEYAIASASLTILYVSMLNWIYTYGKSNVA